MTQDLTLDIQDSPEKSRTWKPESRRWGVRDHSNCRGGGGGEEEAPGRGGLLPPPGSATTGSKLEVGTGKDGPGAVAVVERVVIRGAGDGPGWGVGGPGASLFHLNTHGFFKAGLFLAAGSVILACHHRQDLGGLGGLRRRMPMTWVTTLVCAAALSGLPWLSGFHSKEAILSLALDGAALGGLPALTACLLFVAAALTPVYMFRMVFLAFHGEARSTEAREASEDSWLVRLPLAVLTVLAVVSARFWLFPVEEAPASEHWAGVLGTTLALGGVILAGLLFLLPVLSPAAFARFFGPLTGLARERWKFDALYAATFPPIFRFGGRAVDGFDSRLVDGLAHGIGRMAEAGGSAFRKLHRGRIQTYALLTLAGLLLLSVTLLLQGEAG